MANKANAPNWKKIKAEYIKGVPPRTIAKKYGVNPKTLTSRCYRERWTDERKDVAEKVREKCIEKIADTKADEMTETLASLDRSVLLAARKIERELNTFLDRPGMRITHDMKVKDDDGNPKRMSVTYDFPSAVNALTALRKQVMDERKSSATENIEMEDDGFMDALREHCAEAWEISDEPANMGDSE